MFTFLSHDEIEEKIKEQKKKPETRLCQKYLAKYLTDFVHGVETTDRVEKITNILFNGDITNLDEEDFEEAFSDVEQVNLKINDLINVNLADILVKIGICSSKRQAREDIENKAININGIIYCDVDEKITEDKILFNKYIVIRRGKKNYFLIRSN
ncbi:MAG TPA: S4 domain-containing protein [Candidatus Paceibacterota bacterium]|nr:S4 domain-containing protein [Candidatus Paceibacterota bacterium]